MSDSRHPCYVLAAEIEKKFTTQSRAAESLGVSVSYVSDVLRGKRGMSVELACRLEGAGVGTASGWVRLWCDHEVTEAKKRRAALPTSPTTASRARRRPRRWQGW